MSDELQSGGALGAGCIPNRYAGWSAKIHETRLDPTSARGVRIEGPREHSERQRPRERVRRTAPRGRVTAATR